MTSYTVGWTKTYYMTGEFKVEADDEAKAKVLAHHLIGDQEGSLQYIPFEDSITVQQHDN